MNHKKTIVISAALALGLSSGAMAAQSSFQATQLASGYGNDSGMTKDASENDGSKMSEQSCGGDMNKMKGGSCGADHSKANGGNCGGNMDKMTSGARMDGKMKNADGKCGEGACGADKKSMSH